jgi:hypothetical protein
MISSHNSSHFVLACDIPLVIDLLCFLFEKASSVCREYGGPLIVALGLNALVNANACNDGSCVARFDVDVQTWLAQPVIGYHS